MLSFEILKNDNIGDIVDRFVRESSTDLARIEIKELLSQYLEMSVEQEVEIATAFYQDCVLIRLFDGEEYSFAYPYSIKDGADPLLATVEISKYVRREMIPFFLFDVPREELERLMGTFSHIDASAYLDDDDVFAIRVKNECDLLTSYPEEEKDGIRLSEILDSDIDNYYELCSDCELNKYWGYDFRGDNENPEKDWFLKVSRSEFNTGVALTLAIKKENTLVGEATLFDFDFMGSAEIGVRVLPNYQRQGIARTALSLLCDVAQKIGLKSLRASVKCENTPSVSLIREFFGKESAKNFESGILYFKHSL